MSETTGEQSIPEPEYDSLLVTGGTGFLGLHTCQQFAEMGWDVTAVDLKGFEPEDDADEMGKNGGQVEYVHADVRDREAVQEVFETTDPDAVVHSAAALPLWDDETIHEVTVEGTRTVLQAAEEAGIDRVVYVSSTAVYGTHDSHPITEESPLSGVGPYGDAKIRAEGICEQFHKRGLCVPILRPKTFIGPKRLGVFQVLFDWVEDGANVPLVGWGNNRYQLLHVADLVRAIQLTLALPQEAVDDTFNVGATEFATMKADFQALLDYADTGKRVVGTPAPLTVLALRVLNVLNLSPLYPWVYETAHEDSYVEVEKLRKLGWEPEYSNAEALIDTYEWYLEHYDPDEAGTALDHRAAWDQGALAAVKKVFQVF